MKKNRLYLIDGSGYMYRAFHAIRYLTNSKGMPTNAVFGFTRMLVKILKQEEPDYVGVVFDLKGPTFRHEIYKEYKANRAETPDDLVQQIPYIKRVVEALCIPVIELQGYEADDLIGTYAKKAVRDNFEVVIVTGDKDMYQLVEEDIRIYDELRDRWVGTHEAEERFGVPVERIVEVMGLSGDSVDNIPGVPGIGSKTATELIQQFGSIEEVLGHIDQISGAKRKENLTNHGDDAILSKKLVTIDINAPSPVELETLCRKSPDPKLLTDIFSELEFFTLLKELYPEGAHVPSGVESEYITLDDKGEFLNLLADIKAKGIFAFDFETTSPNPVLAKIVGISFCYDIGKAWYVPLKHRSITARQLNFGWVMDQLRPIFENSSIKKIGQNIKYETIILSQYGIRLEGIAFDTMLASYVLNAAKRSHSLSNISIEYLNHKMIEYKEVVGTGKKEVCFDEVDIPTATEYSAEDSDITYRLYEMLEPKVEDFNDLYYNIELPLVSVLARMEVSGVRIDPDILTKMSKEAQTDIDLLRERILELSGCSFNPDSPSQLADALFEKLELPPIKKIKTGYSTNEAVLEELSLLHPLPGEVLEYRKLKKLQSTYIEALPKLINKNTGRVHPSFNQTVTVTGRLSCSDPNLQNIPVRTEFGKRIRSAFVACDDSHILLSADYSQVELRIMAHLSEDSILIDAFARGEDIHRRTAAQIGGVSFDQVTDEMRRHAKTINFGILYGMGAFGLAKSLKITRKEAQQIIDSYFENLPQVKEYIDTLIENARRDGYATTLFNRRRDIPELQAANGNIRKFGERTAVNTPLQGTAADIIKLAMIRIDHDLEVRNLNTRMILQVHDELLFDVPKEEKDEVSELVQRHMENVVELKTPLVVNIAAGHNWAEIH
jgi:DNA polymerase-1